MRQKTDYSAVPWCTFLDPEVARVGLSETQAKERGVPYEVYTTPIAELDRAVVEEETAGLVKVLTAAGSDRILGVTLVSAHAGEIIHEFVLAMACGIGLGKISRVIHVYPTFAELARKTGDAYQKTASPRPRKSSSSGCTKGLAEYEPPSSPKLTEPVELFCVDAASAGGILTKAGGCRRRPASRRD
jgi:hypothetical protein